MVNPAGSNFNLKIGLKGSLRIVGSHDIERYIPPNYRGYINDDNVSSRPSLTMHLDIAPPGTVSLQGSFISRNDFSFTLDKKNKTASGKVLSSPYSIDSLVRVVCSIVCVENSGLLLHSSGVAVGGRSFIFVGKTGAGKSTIIKKFSGIKRIKPEIKFLSDEIMLVEKNGGNRFFSFATPFWGELSPDLFGGHGTEGYKIARMFFLRKSSRTFVRKMSPDEFIKNLLQNALFFSKDVSSAGKILCIADGLSKNIDACELFFRKDFSAEELYENFMQ